LNPRESQGRITRRQWQLAISLTVAFWVCLFGLAILALAEAPNVAYDSVCDLTNDQGEWADGQWARAGGSATLVGVGNGKGILFSVAHCFDNGGRTATLRFRGHEQSWKAKVVGIDFKHDLAALEIDNPPDVEMPPCVTVARADEGPYAMLGYPYYSNGALCYTVGPLRYSDSGGRAMIAAPIRVASGFSGGGMFNARGEYCGPISGYNDEGLSIVGSGEPFARFASKWIEVRHD
jgi:hypothetical protein